MTAATEDWIKVEAEVSLPIVTAQLLELQFTAPCNIKIMDREAYWLDMCLTPRPHNTRLCYRSHWSNRRFERIGKVFLVPPNEDVLYRSDGGARQRSIFCNIAPQPLSNWLQEDVRWDASRLEASLDICDHRVKELLLRLADELQRPGFASRLLVELITGQLAIELGRYFINFDKIPRTQALAAWRLQLIDERLQEDPSMPTLAELAGLCDLSIRQLTRGFRASRGCSIGEYIANHRVGQAKRLLAGDSSIKIIAYSLGFSSPSGFCSAFRRATGMTPGTFRAATATRPASPP